MMHKADEIKNKCCTEMKRSQFRFADKAKSLRQARKLLKGKEHNIARRVLKEELNRIKFELSNLMDLEYKLNHDTG